VPMAGGMLAAYAGRRPASMLHPSQPPASLGDRYFFGGLKVDLKGEPRVALEIDVALVGTSRPHRPEPQLVRHLPLP